MAHQYITALQLASLQGKDPLIPIIDAITTRAPELAIVGGRPINGTSYNAVIRTAVPTSTGFRKLNEGVELGAATYQQKKFDTFLFERPLRVDAAIDFSSGDYTPEEVKAMAMEAEMSNIAITVGSQFYTGANSATNIGFPGLQAYWNTTLVTDATGTSTGCYRAWFVRLGLDGVHFIWGRNQSFTSGQWAKQQVADSGGTKVHTAWVNSIMGCIGLSAADPYAVGCVKNIKPGTAGKELTDALAYELVSKFPAGRKPTHCFLTPNVGFTLQKTRSVTSLTSAGAGDKAGTNIFSPLPDMIAGCKIIETDGIASESAI